MASRFHLSITAFLLTLIATGCGSPGDAPVPGAGLSGTDIVLDTASVCHDCIILRQVTVLGDSAGTGYVEEAQHIVRDNLGNYWVGQPSSVKVFDSSGRYLRTVGRAGQGPLEFGFPAPVFVDEADDVHILDLHNPRVSIIGPGFNLVNEVHLPGIASSIAPLSNGVRYVVNMTLRTAERLGLPLHIVKGRAVMTSFGAPSEGSIVSPLDLQRVLNTDNNDHIYSSDYYRYEIQAWDSAGALLRSFAGPQLNETKPLPGPWSTENPPPNRIFAIHGDGSIIWVIRWVLKDDWLSRMVEVVLPDGQLQLTPADQSLSSIYECRIDIIDMKSEAIVASTSRPELFISFAADGVLFENRLAPNGTPEIGVWSVALQHRTGS